MSLGAIILLIVLWFRLQLELYSLLTIVLFGFKCRRGGRADSWLSFETHTVNPGWQRGAITTKPLETKGLRELPMSLSGLAIRSAPWFAIGAW